MNAPSKARKPWKWILLVILVVFGGLILYRVWASPQKKSNQKRGGPAEIPVQVAPVIQKNLVYTLKTNGDILPLNQVDLFPKVSGYLEKMLVNLGDSVRQGQIVAQIDRTDFFHKTKEVEAKLAQARAQLSEIEAGTRAEELREAEESVRQARSRFENAKLQRERINALFQRQVISKKEFDLAEMDYTVAEAQWASSEQHLKMLREGARQEVKEASQAKLREMEAILAQERIRLENTSIVAPFSGEIIKRFVDNGALVSPSTPIVTLVHTDTLKIVANVLEKDISLIKIGMKGKIRTDSYPDRVFEGKVARLNSALDLTTRTLQAEIYISNPGRLLKPGMFAKIEVVLSENPNALVIPKYAVLEEKGKRSVFTVKGHQAIRVPVATGHEQEEEIEILEGLSPGDQVVVRGQEYLRDGATVRLIEGG
jgi:HlyD family secretion protein